MNDIAIYDPNKDPGYIVGDYCNYNGLLIRCVENTPSPAGPYHEEYWVQLGMILEGEGFVTMSDGDVIFDGNQYLNKAGDVATGNLSYNISDMTSDTRTPIRYLKGTSSGDMTVIQGAGGTTVIGSGNSVTSNSNIQGVYGLSTNTNNIHLVSQNAISLITNANGGKNYKNALNISTAGEITVMSKTSAARNQGTYLATEAQVYMVDQNKLSIEGGRVTGQIKGIAPVSNEDLTRKDYVDNLVESNIDGLSNEIEQKLTEYVPLAGGTMRGQLKGIAPESASDLTRKDYVDNSISKAFIDFFDKAYPIGSIYMSASTDDVCPLEKLGIGKWVNLKEFAGDTVLQIFSGSNNRKPGSFVPAGLPNITGTITEEGCNSYNGTGALYTLYLTSSKDNIWDDWVNYKTIIGFDASRSNPIYGNSDTVQPPAYVVNAWQRVASTSGSRTVRILAHKIYSNEFEKEYSNNKDITSVSFPNLTYIGNKGLWQTFYRCSKLTGTVSFPALTAIADDGLESTFGYTNINSVSFPRLTTIGSEGLYLAFTNCQKLSSVSFPSLTSVAKNGFKYAFLFNTGITAIHFRADAKSVIEALEDYDTKFGSSNATIYFDL